MIALIRGELDRVRLFGLDRGQCRSARGAALRRAGPHLAESQMERRPARVTLKHDGADFGGRWLWEPGIGRAGLISLEHTPNRLTQCPSRRYDLSHT